MRWPRILLILILLMVIAASPLLATYSIVAFDRETGELGVAVASKFIAVGAAVPFAEAGVGAIATQAWGNTTFGPRGLQMLRTGMTPEEVLDSLLKTDTDSSYRQMGIVDSRGNTIAFTGCNCQSWAGHIVRENFTVQGNILTGEDVLVAMVDAFENSTGSLAERLIQALAAGESAGGDRRGRQAAALLVVREKGGYSGYNDRYIDLRVDENNEPVKELKRIYELYSITFLPFAHLRFEEEYKEKGMIDQAQKEWITAYNLMKLAIEKMPDDASALNSIAWESAQRDYNIDEAYSFARRALEIEPDDPNIMDTMAFLHYKKGEFKKAIELEERAIQLMPENDFFKEQLQLFKGALK